MPNLLPIDRQSARSVALTTQAERQKRALIRSGHSQAELHQWLQKVIDGKEAADVAELAEIDLQQGELLWQFTRLRQQLNMFADDKKMRLRSPLRLMLDRMDSFLSHLSSGAGSLEEFFAKEEDEDEAEEEDKVA